MLKKVQNFILSNQLLQENERILVGVSGGADSVVLLHLLLKLGYQCSVAHCNFHLRDRESDRDEHFVENLAKKYHLIFKKIDFDTLSYSRSEKISIEMAARELRYEWFDKIADETHSDTIAVAHHADDSIETMLLNLVRGTGLKGLTGIEARNERIIRPLLCCTREEIEAYAKKNDLQYVIDSTNAGIDYTRNRIRNQIIPLFSEINPAIKQTFHQNILRLKGVWKIYTEKIDEIKNQILSQSGNQSLINIKELKNQPDAPTVLYEILKDYHFNSNVIKDICQGLNDESGLKYFSSTHRLLKDREQLIISEIEPKADVEFLIQKETKQIASPIALTIKKIKRNAEFQVSRSPKKIHIDADKIKFPLTIRKWRKGDRFQPFGMKQSKKLSDFFIDEKLNLYQKEEVLLLTSDDKIVWIIGMRVDNRFRITSKTQNIVEIRVKQEIF